MNRSLLLLAAASTSLLFGQSAAAQTTVATDPVGFTTLTVNAKPANIRGFTQISLNMMRPEVFRGLVPSVSTSNGQTSITFPANTFTQGQFDGTHFLEVVNGANAGRLSDIATTVNSQSESVITLADDLSGSLTAGSSSVKIRPMWTLGTAFGVNNSAGFQGGPTSTSADIIQLFNPTNGQSTLYFYNTTAQQWRRGAVDATNDVIPPDAGLRVERKASTPVSFTLPGAVKLGPTGLFVQGGSNAANPQNSNYVPNPYPMNSVTLANSNLYTGDPATGVLGGATASQADTVSLYDTATGQFTNYFYKTTAPAGWRTGAQDASNVVIPEGASVLIKRKNTQQSFIWYVPQPAMNL